MPLDEEMSKEAGAEASADERARLKEEKKRLKAEKKEQKKIAKQRAKEIADQEAEMDEDASTGSVLAVTFVIVLIWAAILCLIVKLDFGGFGSRVLTPVLKDVPVLNLILPNKGRTPSGDGEEEEEIYGGYDNLQDAVEYIKELELELERAQSSGNASEGEVEELKKQVERLQTFEDAQVEFQRIKTEFDEEVVYAEKGPGLEEYKKYYEQINPATAEYLYKQAVQQIEESDDIKDFAQAYSSMKPKAAAAIFEQMMDNTDLVARILGVMEANDRGAILAQMDPENASRITKIMDPES